MSSQSLLVVSLNSSRRSTSALLEVSSPTFRCPLTDYSRPSLLPSSLSRSHPANTRCQRPHTAPRGIGPCQGKYSTATYPMFDNTTFPKRDTTLEKRDGIVLTRNSDISYECLPNDELAPIWSDCEALCIRLGTGTLSVRSRTSPSLP